MDSLEVSHVEQRSQDGDQDGKQSDHDGSGGQDILLRHEQTHFCLG